MFAYMYLRVLIKCIRLKQTSFPGPLSLHINLNKEAKDLSPRNRAQLTYILTLGSQTAIGSFSTLTQDRYSKC